MIKQKNNLKNWLALNHLYGLTCFEFEFLVDAVKKQSISLDSSNAILKREGLTSNILDQIKKINWSTIDDEMTWEQQEHHHIISIENSHYPQLLREISSPPIVLYARGNKDCLCAPQFAMVGSRNPTIMGVETAQRFAEYLAQTGLNITSGLALGIDGASHKGALRSGKTIAVLGCGLSTIYPVQHAALSEAIVHSGLLISEFPLTTPPRRENFPRRNRIISGLSVGVLVVEAALRSGSLITAKFAGEQGREVFAIPGSIHNPLSRGCHRLIRDGAKLVETAQDVFDELKPLVSAILPGELEVAKENNICKVGSTVQKNHFEKLDDDYQKLLSCIGYESTSIDCMIVRSGFDSRTVSSMLLILELEGFIAAVPGGYSRS